jgi:hypothetical protein
MVMWRKALVLTAVLAALPGEMRAGPAPTVTSVDRSNVRPAPGLPFKVPIGHHDTAPSPSPRTMPHLGLVGRRLRGPQTGMSEAGITFAFGKRVTLDLSYERTSYAPLMPHDHDDGILTALKIGF